VNHRSNKRWSALLVGAAVLLLAACDQSAPAAETASRGTAPGAPMRVDMDQIFPAGPGRDLVLNNCQTCHTWVPIVVLQMNEAEWYRSSLEHRGRVQGLNDQEFETLYDYLKASFTPDTPVPELPPALLESWTTY
jgi:cytochrome c5